MHTANAATVRKLACEPVGMALLDKLEFIALKEKGSTNEVSIYFFWRDTDKIRSAKHDRHEVAGFWRWKN